MQAIAQVFEGLGLGHDALGGTQAGGLVGHVLAQLGTVGQQNAQVKQRRRSGTAWVGHIGQRLRQPDDDVGLAQPGSTLQQNRMRLLPVAVQQGFSHDLIGLFRVECRQRQGQRRPNVALVDLGLALVGIQLAHPAQGLVQHGALRWAGPQHLGAGGGAAGAVLVEEVNLAVNAIRRVKKGGQVLRQCGKGGPVSHLGGAHERGNQLVGQGLYQRLGVAGLQSIVNFGQQPVDVGQHQHLAHVNAADVRGFFIQADGLAQLPAQLFAQVAVPEARPRRALGGVVLARLAQHGSARLHTIVRDLFATMRGGRLAGLGCLEFGVGQIQPVDEKHQVGPAANALVTVGKLALKGCLGDDAQQIFLKPLASG